VYWRGKKNRRLSILAVAPSKYEIKVDDQLDVDVYALAYGGEGIAKHNGLVIFVPEALPGDRVKIKIFQVKKRFARGGIIDVVKSSSKRISPFCLKAEQCGGCNWQHFDYGEQLKTKQAFVENAIQHVGKLKAIHICPTIKATQTQAYRHKIQIPFQQIDQELKAGFYAKQTHRIIPIEECPVQPAISNRVYKTFMELAKSYGFTGYQEEDHQGQIRHLVIRVGKNTKDVLVIIVTNGVSVPKLQDFAQALHQAVPEIVGIVQNVNQAVTNVILGPGFKTLYGRAYLYEEIRNIKYRISAESFFQVNPYQLDHLAETVMKYAALTGKEKVVDLYCGVGFFTFEAAKQARMVYGIENVANAIEDAKANKYLNQISNVEFKCQDATTGVDQLINKGFMPDVLILDPPRKGCDPKLLQKMTTWKTKRIVYVSCNPVTLARDLAVLNNAGYWIQQIQPIDLFPHTYHIESVASLIKKK